MSGGFLNGIEYPGKAMTAHSAITYPGTLVKIYTTEGEVELCGAGDFPDGYVHMGSISMATGSPVATAGAKVAVKGLVPGTVIEVPLLATNAAIAVGDELETVAGGLVDKKNGAGEIIGKAMVAVDASAGAGSYVKVWVAQRTAAA
jgi:hypothetical protein